MPNPYPPEAPDPYWPLRNLVPCGEWILEILLRSLRRDSARALKGKGVKRVLDLGCGTGVFCRRLAAGGLLPVCLDPSPTLLSRAAQRAFSGNRFSILRGDGRRLPFRAEFDAVMTVLTLHEMDPETREEVWKEGGRVLRADGFRFLVDYAVPEKKTGLSFLWGWATRLAERKMGKFHPPHYHNYLEFMGGGGLKAWVAARGGEILEERRYGGGHLALFVTRR